MGFITILVVTIVQIAIGMIWFGPLLFGNFWMKVNGVENVSPEEMKKMQKEAAPFYILQTLVSLATQSILYFLIREFNKTLLETLIFTVLLWAGFMLPVVIQGELWTSSNNSMKIKKTLVVGGHLLLSMLVSGLVFGI